MPTLSTHVLDTERGQPAGGVRISLSRRDGEAAVPVAEGVTDQDGRIQELGGQGLQPATYLIRFDSAGYFGSRDRDAPFLQSVAIEFRILADGGHYHVPLLLSRYSCTSYRGS